MKKLLYFSPFGYLINGVFAIIAFIKQPLMSYGYFDRKKFILLRNVRISTTAKILDKNNLKLGDHVWIWHHSIIDSSGGLTIGEGSQIGAWVGIFTHSSHIAIRLLGSNFINFSTKDRIGYVKQSVEIGAYTFIGASSLILPGTKIGKGCVISAGSIVKGNIPDYSIVVGNPAKVVGNVKDIDKKFLSEDVVLNNYFDKQLLNEMLDKLNRESNML